LFIKDINSAIACRSWNTSWEIGELVQLIEVLSSLKKDFLVVVQVIVWVDVSIAEKIAILLKILDLVVEVDEFLGLLFYQ
jgi:hypothetical protein